MAQLVEHNLAKVGVAGSSPVVRSIAFPDRLGGPFSAKWPSGKAEACKAFTPGSNPGVASNFFSEYFFYNPELIESFLKVEPEIDSYYTFAA